jgi:hypothetical protein
VFQDATETEPRSAALARVEDAIGVDPTNEALREGRRLQLDEAVDLALCLFADRACGVFLVAGKQEFPDSGVISPSASPPRHTPGTNVRKAARADKPKAALGTVANALG